jgi:hypothetical protein
MRIPLQESVLHITRQLMFSIQVSGNIYRSDLRWWAGATALDVITILVLLPLFKHWWKFDRSRSFSPFEMALAFNAPLLDKVPSNAGPEGVVHQIGSLRVKFGSVVQDERLHKGVVSDNDTACHAGSQRSKPRRRLGIHRIENIDTPSEGMYFDL